MKTMFAIKKKQTEYTFLITPRKLQFKFPPEVDVKFETRVAHTPIWYNKNRNMNFEIFLQT